MLAEKSFTAKNISINYVEGPHSGQPVVMLHGVTNRWQDWLPVLPFFGWRYHTYALDHRGHGRSGRAIDGYQSNCFAKDVIQFLQDIVGQPVVLVGHSLGAMITLRVAAQAPELIQAVVLGDPPLSDAADSNGPIPPWFQQYLDLIRSDRSREDKLAKLAKLTRETDPGAHGTAIHAHFKALELMDPQVLIAGVERQLFIDFMLADILPQIYCPVLLIRGNPALGGVITDKDFQRALRLLPQATDVYVANMGHNLHAPQPHTFFSMVSNFIEGLE